MLLCVSKMDALRYTVYAKGHVTKLRLAQNGRLGRNGHMDPFSHWSGDNETITITYSWSREAGYTHVFKAHRPRIRYVRARDEERVGNPESMAHASLDSYHEQLGDFRIAVVVSSSGLRSVRIFVQFVRMRFLHDISHQRMLP